MASLNGGGGGLRQRRKIPTEMAMRGGKGLVELLSGINVKCLIFF